MKSIPKPTADAREVFDTCISKVRNTNLKDRLVNISSKIGEAAIEYEEKAIHEELHLIEQMDGVECEGGTVTTDELKAVYTQRMVGGPGRLYYDQLIIGAEGGVCPFCVHKDVTQLDHHLPKSDYPIFSVLPCNLIPICSDCNKIKDTASPVEPEEQTIHPYFDNVENDIWLEALVVERTPVVVAFRVNPPDSWSQLLQDRLHYHFELLELAKLYSNQAASELSDIKGILVTRFNNGGVQNVKNYLEENVISRSAANKNSWKAALYRGLMNSDWFCEGGFND